MQLGYIFRVTHGVNEYAILSYNPTMVTSFPSHACHTCEAIHDLNRLAAGRFIQADTDQAQWARMVMRHRTTARL